MSTNEEQENKENQQQTSDSEGVSIEVRELSEAEGSLPSTGAVARPSREDEKERVIKELLFELTDEFYTYLSGKPLAKLKRYQQGEPIDVVLDFVNDYSDLIYRRIVRLHTSLQRISRLTGGGARPIAGPRALEQMLWERIAQSMAGSLEGSFEAQRRRKVSEEIIRELMSEREGGEGEGEGKGENE